MEHEIFWLAAYIFREGESKPIKGWIHRWNELDTLRFDAKEKSICLKINGMDNIIKMEKGDKIVVKME